MASPPACDFHWQAPDFTLPGTDGKTYTLDGIRGRNGTLVMFICNHCPYVTSVLERLIADVKTCNTYLLRQHPCTPAWDGKPKANFIDNDKSLGRQPFTSPSRLVKCRPVA